MSLGQLQTIAAQLLSKANLKKYLWRANELQTIKSSNTLNLFNGLDQSEAIYFNAYLWTKN